MTFTKRSQDTADVRHRKSGAVSYLDGSTLLRPQTPTKEVFGVMAIAVAIALIIGGTIGYKAIDSIMHGEEKKAAQIEQMLYRGVTLEIPDLASLFYLDDATLIAQLTDDGYPVIDIDALTAEMQDVEYVDNPGVDLVCAPTDVDLNKAKQVYAKGFNSADAVTIAQYYNTSWHLITDVDNGVLSVKYSDFANSTPEAALDTAMATQGWLDSDYVTVDDSGVDEAGNTYRTGAVYSDYGDFGWRISTCLLSAAFDVHDLPESAHYVGIKIYPL